MSVEWFLQAYETGNDQNIATSIVLDIIKSVKNIKSNESIDLVFDKNNYTTLYLDSKLKTLSSIMISRPIKHPLFYEIIFKIMMHGNFVLFAPDANYSISLVNNIKEQLPEGMIEGIGELKIAENENDFIKLLENFYCKRFG